MFDSLLLERIAQPLGWHGYDLGTLLSVLLVSAVCGLLSSLVVGNRMAFFSDAMAHCAFAGISLGMVIAISTGVEAESDEMKWLVPLVMATFGALVGVGISFVREQTGLANDTVIGVFFAGAIGIGAMTLTAFQDKKFFDPERFLFGGPIFATPFDILLLMVLLIATLFVLCWRYNQFLFASFNPSLARSRGIAVAANNYLLIVLLALVVNFSISAVGVMLINAMLIVPAAAASNISINMRQMFRYTLFLSVATGLAGLFVSKTMVLKIGSQPRQFGVSGTIICISVTVFAATMVVQYLRRKFQHLG